MFDLYGGNTTGHFRSRWTNCKSDARKADCDNMKKVKQKFLQSHFLQRDYPGFLKDLEVRLIDKQSLIQPKGCSTE